MRMRISTKKTMTRTRTMMARTWEDIRVVRLELERTDDPHPVTACHQLQTFVEAQPGRISAVVLSTFQSPPIRNPASSRKSWLYL
jgi:hypothetical protein